MTEYLYQQIRDGYPDLEPADRYDRESRKTFISQTISKFATLGREEFFERHQSIERGLDELQVAF